MKNLKKAGLLFGLLVIIASMVFAGGGEQQGTAVKRNTLKIAAQGNSYFPAIASIVEMYKQANPDLPYDVQLSEIVADNSDAYTKAIMLMSSPTTCPDVMLEDSFRINEDALAGHLYSIDNYVKGWNDIKQWSPSTLEGCTGEDGQLYGLPLSSSFVGLWYNKPMLQKAGYTIPFQPKTWNEILEAARKMKAAAGDPEFIPYYLFISASDSERTSMKTFQTLLSGTSTGVLYDYSKAKWIVDYPNFVKVLNHINTVYNVEKLGPPVSLATQTNNMAVIGNGQMIKGQLGFLVESQNVCTTYWSTGAAQAWPNWQDVWGFGLVPTETGNDAGFTSMIGGWSLVIPNNSQNKDAAWKFLSFLGTFDGMLEMALKSGQMTPRLDVAASSEYTNNKYAVYQEIDTTAMLKYGHNRPTTNNYSQVSLLVAEMTEAVGTGTSVDNAINNYRTQLVRLVGANNVEIRE
jgi:multiple sugar transport system substrate-binding protein